MKRIMGLLILVIFYIWVCFSIFMTVIDYDSLNDSLNFKDNKNEEFNIENKGIIKIETNAKKQQGIAEYFYPNGVTRVKLNCTAYPASFMRLFFYNIALIDDYKVKKVRYQCDRQQYYENENLMLSAKYESGTRYAVDVDIFDFLRKEVSYIYSDIHDLIVGVPLASLNKITGTSVSYYEKIPTEIKNSPRGIDTCISNRGTGLFRLEETNDTPLCRKEEYTKYASNQWNVVKYLPTGRLKSNVIYKDIYKGEILKGKIYNDNGSLSVEFLDDGNRILVYNENRKLYKETTLKNNERKNSKIYAANGDLEYILFFKDDKPYKGYKYEKGKEIPLTNAHIYNIFNMKTDIEKK